MTVQVPVSTENHVALRPVGNERFQYAPSRDLVDPAIANFGQTASGLADQMDDNDRHFASATAKDAFNQVQQYYADHGFSQPDSFFNLKGKEAVTAQPDFEKGVGDYAEDVSKGLSPFAKKLFNDAYGNQRADWTRQIGAHVGAETKQYNIDQTTGRAGLALDAAHQAVLSGAPDALEQSDRQIATARDEYGQLGRALGWAPERTQLETTAHVSAARHDIGVTLLNSGAQGPDAAEAYRERYQNELTGDDDASLTDHIRSMRNAQEAEQRRIEAEARRQAAEAKHEAGERAADVARLADAGVVLTPGQTASAIGDARLADRPGLEFSLRQAAFKNDLTLQWQDATPAQIQDRLNELGPQIAKAKGPQSLQLHTEFDHLQTLLGKSSSELKEDPLSWGAQHLGVHVPPLNWTDPGAITARVSAARSVASKTGAPLRVLTNEEAASMAPTVATGSMQQRRALIDNLSRFGSLGPQAAAQVAPSNDQFVSLIGLATGHSRPASAQHVEWVLAGQEVLKSNPKLIEASKAKAVFASETGGALELLPSLQNGVLANASAIAAARAQHQGATDWGSGGGAVFKQSVNDALGGYTQNGEMFGGLHLFNGRKTLMPDGMSAGQFETAIAKAPTVKWQKAMNGNPVDAGGHGFTFGQLRKMQWVAVGDGRYRLTDGAHYVGRKDGGLFEVDVRKMR